MGKIHCHDCKHWVPPRKTYMVSPELWEKFGVGKKHLCLKCFEVRLGRTLGKEEFTNCPVNEYNKEVQEIILGSSA